MSGSDRPLTGRIPAGQIRVRHLPVLRDDLLEQLRGLPDLTSTVSDAMDQLGLTDRVSSCALLPRVADARLVGRATTLRNARRRDGVAAAVAAGSRLADLECHNLAQPGDILVVEGDPEISSMGAFSAQIGRRQGELGAIVDGAVRDVGQFAGLGYPVWSSAVSPRTGKYRLVSEEVNGTVAIGGVAVSPGDVVVADASGVCFIPHDALAVVAARAIALVEGERTRVEAVRDGVTLARLAAMTPGRIGREG